MFREGDTYEVTMWVTGPAGGANQAWLGRVVEVSGPLVRFQDAEGNDAIVNTHSIAFIGARAARE